MSEKKGLFGFPPEEVELIKKTVGKNAINEAEFERFLYRANKLGINPLDGSIHLLRRNMRNSKGGWEPTNVIVVGIDTLRAIGDSTGKLTGIARDVIYNEKGELTHAWAEVYRNDWSRPAREVVSFKEFCQTDEKGQPIGLWKTKEETLLKKCAEAGAHRMAWASRLVKIYIFEEINENEEDITSNKFIQTTHANHVNEKESLVDPEVNNVDPNPDANTNKVIEYEYVSQIIITEIIEEHKTWIEVKGTDFKDEEVVLLVPKRLNVNPEPGMAVYVTGKRKGSRVKVSEIEIANYDSAPMSPDLNPEVVPEPKEIGELTVFSAPRKGIYSYLDGTMKDIIFVLADSDDDKRHILSFFSDEDAASMAKNLKVNDRIVIEDYKKEIYKDKPIVVVKKFSVKEKKVS